MYIWECVSKPDAWQKQLRCLGWGREATARPAHLEVTSHAGGGLAAEEVGAVLYHALDHVALHDLQGQVEQRGGQSHLDATPANTVFQPRPSSTHQPQGTARTVGAAPPSSRHAQLP